MPDELPKNPVTGFVKLEIPQQKKPDMVPIFPKRREVSFEDHPLVVTNLDASQARTAKFHNGDSLSATDGSFDVICFPSEDSIKTDQPCQDCMGVVKLVGNNGHESLLVVQADGVGSAYLSEIASGVAVRAICENGTDNLLENLTMAAGRLKGFGTSHPEASTPDLLKEALASTRREFGTHTTVNQLNIDLQEGNYEDVGLGDGELVVVRANHTIERNKQGTATSRLTSRIGLEGVTTSQKGTLQAGDTVFMYSDGLDALSDTSLVELANLSGDELHNVIEQLIPKLRDDDRGFFIYHRR